MTESDARYVETLKARLKAAGYEKDVEWLPNVTREEKIAFLESLTLFSVPATYGEAFGLYVIEALAANVPVVLPRTGAFFELVGNTGGGHLFDLGATETESVQNLATALEAMLADPVLARSLGQAGRRVVQSGEYTMANFAGRLVQITREMIDEPQAVH